jgi:hypothetical protein
MSRPVVLYFALGSAVFLATGCGTTPEEKSSSKQTSRPAAAMQQVTIHVPEMKDRLNLE